jgi:hypothetical protein
MWSHSGIKYGQRCYQIPSLKRRVETFAVLFFRLVGSLDGAALAVNDEATDEADEKLMLIWSQCYKNVFFPIPDISDAMS